MACPEPVDLIEGEKNVCEPWAGAESPCLGRVPAPGNLDPVTLIQALAAAERVCCQWLS